MSSSYDFRAVGAVVNVLSVDTGKTGTFTVLRTKDAQTHLPYFHSLTIKETKSGYNEVSVQLQPPTYEDALNLLESPWLTIGNTLSVKWGYTKSQTHWSPWFHTMMLKPEISFGDEFGITMKGAGFGWQMGRITNGRQWSIKNGKPSMSRYAIIEEVAEKRHGFEINWNNSGVKSPGKPSVDKQGWSEHSWRMLNFPDNVNQGYLNDFMFIKRLAAECGCRATMTRGKVWNIIDAAKSKKPDFILVYRDQIDPFSNVFPIESFTSDSTPLFLPMTKLSAKFLNPNSPKSKLAKQWDASESTVKANAFGGNKVPTANPQSPRTKGPDKATLPVMKKPDPKAGATYMPISPRKENIEARVQSMYALKTAEAHGISAQVSGPAIPAMLPESMVTVKGVGRYFSVNYRVGDVTTTVGSDFAKQDTELLPKGFPGGIAKWLTITAPQSDTQEASPGAAGSDAEVSSSGRMRHAPE